MKRGDLVMVNDPDSCNYSITVHGSIGVITEVEFEIYPRVEFFNINKSYGTRWQLEPNTYIHIEPDSILYYISGAYKYEREIEKIRAEILNGN